jgi:hypothetical protein
LLWFFIILLNVILLPNIFEKHQCHNALLECIAMLIIENTIEDPELKTL